jgi:hypothetical protein
MAFITSMLVLTVLDLAAMSRGAQQMTAAYSEGLNQQFMLLSGGYGLDTAQLPAMFTALQIDIAKGCLGAFETVSSWKQNNCDLHIVQALYAANTVFWGGMLAVLGGIRRLAGWAGGYVKH